jgi:hypothetical protein
MRVIHEPGEILDLARYPEHDVSALPSVAAVGTPLRHERLAAERGGSVATAPAAHLHVGLVRERHRLPA